MSTRMIQYRFAALLRLAVLVLVMNPVLHAFGHNHFDESGDVVDFVSHSHWTSDDVCPFCDAVFQQAASTNTDVDIVPAAFYSQLDPETDLYTDLRLRSSTRLRAPPC